MAKTRTNQSSSTKLTICALVPEVPHKRSKASKFTSRSMKYFGLGVIINEIKNNYGITVDFVDYTKVNEYDIVLYSLHSVEDFYNLVFTVDYKIKPFPRSTWICGGAGIGNFRMILPYFDFIVLGRGERLIIDIIDSYVNDTPIGHTSIIERSKHIDTRNYRINYADQLYTETVAGRSETMYGCKYNCYYCRYRYSSLPPTKRKLDNKTTMPGNEETFWDLHIIGGYKYTTSLDGFSERQRYAVNKPISNQAIIDKLVNVPDIGKTISLKIYFIAGYPGETKLDISEFIDTVKIIDKIGLKNRTILHINVTPFSAEPNTPMQWESMNLNVNFRDLFKDFEVSPGILYNGEHIQVVKPNLISSPFTLAKRAIFNRGYESDLQIVRDILAVPFLKSHNNTHNEKLEFLNDRYDLRPFIKEYPIGTPLASSNIHSWQEQRNIETMAAKFRLNQKKITLTT